MADLKLIKEIRNQTGASVKDINKALSQAKDNKEKALIILEKKGKKIALQKSQRNTNEGIIEAYIHANGKVGVLIEIACETDFVARNEAFAKLAHNIAMHIAAMAPMYVSEDYIPVSEIKKKEAIIADSDDVRDKPKQIQLKIIQGKISAYKSEISLLDQSFVKDQDKTIANLIQDATAKLGEKIEIKRFTRFAL